MYSLLTFLSLLLFPNLRVSPIEGPIAWLLLIPLSYFILDHRNRLSVPSSPFLRFICLSCLLLFFFYSLTFNIVFFKYIILMVFCSLLYSKSLQAFINFSLSRFKLCVYIYNSTLIFLLSVHFLYPNFFYIISTSFMSTYYGPILRFSGLNGEPGPMAFAIVLCYTILLILFSLLDFTFPIAKSFTFQLSIFLTLFSFLLTFSLGAFIYFLVSISYALIMTLCIYFKPSMSPSMFSKRVVLFFRRFGLLIIVFLLLIFFTLFAFGDSLALFFNKVTSTFLAVFDNNISQIPSRGTIFANFINTNYIFDFSVLFKSDSLTRTNVSALLSSLDQGSIVLTIIVFLIPSLQFITHTLSLFYNSSERLRITPSFIFLTQFCFIFCVLNYITLPEIHLYKFYIYLLFYSHLTSFGFLRSYS